MAILAAVTFPMVSMSPELLYQLMDVRTQRKLSFSLELCVSDLNIMG